MMINNKNTINQSINIEFSVNTMLGQYNPNKDHHIIT